MVGAPITWLADRIEPHVALFNVFAATLEVLIEIGLLWRRTIKAALVVSFVWAAGIWFADEGLGMLLTDTASPLTGAPSLALIWLGFSALWLLPSKRRLRRRARLNRPRARGCAVAVQRARRRSLGDRGLHTAIAIGLTVVSAAIGLAVLFYWRPRAFLVLAITLSLLYWILGQGLGGVFTGQAQTAARGRR